MKNSAHINNLTRKFLESSSVSRLFCEGIQDSFYGTIPTSLSQEHCHKLEELPISEAAAIGLVTGAAIFGIKPIVCFQRVEFGLLALDQLITNASKTKYLSCGVQTSPFLLRMVIGRGWGQGPCHSQSFEAIWSSIPGIDVYMPATSADYTAIFNKLETTDSPILSLEHRWTHLTNIDTSVGSLFPDSVVTVVSNSYNSIIATKVSAYLTRNGINIDVFHLLSPSDSLDSIRSSVAKTGRLITMDIGTVRHGLGGELIAQLAELGAEYLVPPVRLGSPFQPASASPEEAFIHFASAESLLNALCKLLPGSSSQINKARNELASDTGNPPSDTPNSSFFGPF